MTQNSASKPEATPADRARALHKALLNKKLIPDNYIENFTRQMEHDWDPANGARVVARAWVDPAYRALLLKDGTAACEQFGYTGPQGEYIVALENTPQLQNVIVCSLCSCTNWPVLGLPPEWYKSFEYRARLVREGRTVLHRPVESAADCSRLENRRHRPHTGVRIAPKRPIDVSHKELPRRARTAGNSR